VLEASGFDFRGRHPQQLLIKLAKHYGLMQHSAVVKTAYAISLDIYRTFAPLKQVTACIAFACLELAGRLHNEPTEAIEKGVDYRSWKVNRSMVMGKLSALPNTGPLTDTNVTPARNPPRPPRTLHALPHQHPRRPTVCGRHIPQRPHPAKRRSRIQTSPSLHRVERAKEAKISRKRQRPAIQWQPTVPERRLAERSGYPNPATYTDINSSQCRRANKRHPAAWTYRRKRPRWNGALHAESGPRTGGEEHCGGIFQTCRRGD
jgi:hypothetical protein